MMKESTTVILTVSELNEQIGKLLETRFDVIWVEGEVSNLRRPSSGHLYFTLKDEKSQIRAVIFKYLPGSRSYRNNRPPLFELEEGLRILCRGRLAVYSPRGEYQLILDSLELRGTGALQRAYEQLKSRLQAEGLFDPLRKKPIPYLPRRIGVITSPSGAVIRDILNVSGRRFPSVSILVAPVRVQGFESAGEIVQAFSDLHTLGGIDVIILARGGGSLEDLAPFNDERVARAISSSRIPVISAVGHETDYTISDFVSDLRAPTPSAAAELAVPNRIELRAWLADMQTRISESCRRKLSHHHELLSRQGERLKDPNRKIAGFRLVLDDREERLLSLAQERISRDEQKLAFFSMHLQQAGPLRRIRNSRLELDLLNNRLDSVCHLIVERARKAWAVQATLLDSLSPLAVLSRGYSISRTLPEGRIIRDAATLAAGDSLEIQVFKGRLQAEVSRIFPE